MKSEKTETKTKSKFSFKDFIQPTIKLLKKSRWFLFSVAITLLLAWAILFLSGPVPVWTQIVSQKWDSISFDIQKTKYQPAQIYGGSRKVALRFYQPANAPDHSQHTVTVKISSPSIQVYDITDFFQPASIDYREEQGGYYLSLFDIVNSQQLNISFDGDTNSLQHVLIKSYNNSTLELQDMKVTNAEMNAPSVTMIANGRISFTWDLPPDCFFNIQNWKDHYTREIPSISTNSQCAHASRNVISTELTQYAPNGGSKVMLVTIGMGLPGEVASYPPRQYLFVMDRNNNYSELKIDFDAIIPNMDLDATYEPENKDDYTKYFSVFNPGYSYQISKSSGIIKLGSQTISTDDYSDIELVSKTGNYFIDITGTPDNPSSPFMMQSETLATNLKINFDEMIRTRWSVFPTEIWSAIIGGLMTIIGTYLGYSLGKKRINPPGATVKESAPLLDGQKEKPNRKKG